MSDRRKQSVLERFFTLLDLSHFYAICFLSLDDIPVEQLNILAISHFYAIFLCSLDDIPIGKLNILDLHPEDYEQLDRFRNAAALKVVPIVFEIRQKL